MRRSGVVGGLAASLVAGLLVGCGGSTAPPGGSLVPPQAGALAGPAPANALQVHPRGFRSVRGLPPIAEPDRLRIPVIGVDTRLDRLGQEPDGGVQVPPHWQVAGWYDRGPKPGEPGPAAVFGHIDSFTGPAVFARLAELHPGDLVLVDEAEQVLRFRVTDTISTPKDRFPTDQVYLPTLEPVLRLITCGGRFDPAKGHYTDNVIVSARLETALP